MSNYFEDAFNYAKERWPTKRAALFLSAAVAVGAVFFFAEFDLAAISSSEWGVVVAVVGVPWIAWAWSHRIPRHRKGFIGFGVAIAYEDPQHGARLKADFTGALRKLLSGQAGHPGFHFVEYPQHISRKVEGIDDARELIGKSRGHFLIFGSAKRRVLDGETTHVLEMEGVVRHAEVAHEVSARLAEEFRAVFPRNLHVAEENDLFALRVTAQWVDVSARYVVANAALISGDLDYAEQLLRQLEAEFQASNVPGVPAAAHIQNKLPIRIADLLKLRIGRLGSQYMLKHDPEPLKRSEPILDELAKYDSAWYSGHLHRAICAFVLRRDLSEAYAALKNCEGNPDPTWLYSKAFLKAYEGDLRSAADLYRKAFRKDPSDPSVPIQTEEFMNIVLAEEPHRVELHFCLGLVNYKSKKDLAAARRDFEHFLARTGEEQHARERGLARKWIDKIDKTLRRRREEAGTAA